MNANNVSLSQAELDKLLGISNKKEQKKSASPIDSKQKYKTEQILTEEELTELQKKFSAILTAFKKNLKKEAGEPANRILKLSSVENQNIDQFFDTTDPNDFLYKVTFGRTFCIIKLDRFLFSALAGLPVDTMSETNIFQSIALSLTVVMVLSDLIKKEIEITSELKSLPLTKTDAQKLKTGRTGVCVSFNWNENLRSFGIEKIFLPKQIAKKLIKK